MDLTPTIEPQLAMLPARPVRPDLDSADPDFIPKMLEYQERLGNYQMAVQIAQQDMQAIFTMTTNLERSHHDAMMAIIRNLH
jgi:hypothetical protein